MYQKKKKLNDDKRNKRKKNLKNTYLICCFDHYTYNET